MAPIVHGLEEEYRGRVEFVYLDVSAERTAAARQEFGFESTPHFFLRNASGDVVWAQQGEVSREQLEQRLDQVINSDGSLPGKGER